MTRLLSLLVAFAAIVAPSASATAQEPLHHDNTFGHHGLSFDHDYWHHDVHVPNVAQLDIYADQLAKIARHLHEDAHKLSQDYEHSESIEYYVDQIDRLQKHMHEILHEAAESGIQSTALTSHIKSDVRQVNRLMSRLYYEIQHQGYDGARTEDFHAMSHMREIISQQSMPLLRQMEFDLYGYSPHDYLRSFHSRPLSGRPWTSQRIRIHH